MKTSSPDKELPTSRGSRSLRHHKAVVTNTTNASTTTVWRCRPASAASRVSPPVVKDDSTVTGTGRVTALTPADFFNHVTAEGAC